MAEATDPSSRDLSIGQHLDGVEQRLDEIMVTVQDLSAEFRAGNEAMGALLAEIEAWQRRFHA